MGKSHGEMDLGSGAYVLEEPVNVAYHIVGYPEWLEHAIPVSLKSKVIPVTRGFEGKSLDRIKNYLAKFKVHGMDTESGGPNDGVDGRIKPDGLNPLSETSKLYMFQYGTEERVFIMDPDMIPFFRDELESDKFLKINQNIVHDFKFLLKKYDVHMVRMYCTMLAQQLILAGVDGFKVGLLDLMRSYAPFTLISKAVRSEFAKSNGKFTQKMIEYGARDVSGLFGVFNGQCAELRRLRLNQVAQLEFNVIAPTAEMELTGVVLDRAMLLLTQSYYEKELELCCQKIIRLFNEALQRCDRRERGFIDSLFTEQMEVFDLNSTTQKMAALERIGIKVKNIQRSTLKLLGTELTLAMGEYSELMKVVSTYGENMMQKIQPDTQRLHSEFHQMGRGDFDSGKDSKETIATGRFSSPIQQLPKPKDLFDVLTDPAEIAMVQGRFADVIPFYQAKRTEFSVDGASISEEKFWKEAYQGWKQQMKEAA